MKSKQGRGLLWHVAWVVRDCCDTVVLPYYRFRENNKTGIAGLEVGHGNKESFRWIWQNIRITATVFIIRVKMVIIMSMMMIWGWTWPNEMKQVVFNFTVLPCNFGWITCRYLNYLVRYVWIYNSVKGKYDVFSLVPTEVLGAMCPYPMVVITVME